MGSFGTRASTPITSLFRKHPAKKRKVDPLESVAKTLKSLIEQQANIRAKQERDCEENRQLHDESTKRFDAMALNFIENIIFNILGGWRPLKIILSI